MHVGVGGWTASLVPQSFILPATRISVFQLIWVAGIPSIDLNKELSGVPIADGNYPPFMAPINQLSEDTGGLPIMSWGVLK